VYANREKNHFFFLFFSSSSFSVSLFHSKSSRKKERKTKTKKTKEKEKGKRISIHSTIFFNNQKIFIFCVFLLLFFALLPFLFHFIMKKEHPIYQKFFLFPTQISEHGISFYCISRFPSWFSFRVQLEEHKEICVHTVSGVSRRKMASSKSGYKATISWHKPPAGPRRVHSLSKKLSTVFAAAPLSK